MGEKEKEKERRRLLVERQKRREEKRERFFDRMTERIFGSVKKFALVVLAAALTLALTTQTALAVRQPRSEGLQASSLPVQVDYYMESLCPDCAAFGMGNLTDAVFKLGKYMKINIYAYGNTQVVDKHYVCQHGHEECFMNLVENCVPYLSNYRLIDYWPFMMCADEIVTDLYPNITGISGVIMKHCNNMLPESVPETAVIECAGGAKGAQLLLQARYKTDMLNPTHTSVPWVPLDTKPIYDKYNNTSELICEEWGVLNSRNSDECRNAIYA